MNVKYANIKQFLTVELIQNSIQQNRGAKFNNLVISPLLVQPIAPQLDRDLHSSHYA